MYFASLIVMVLVTNIKPIYHNSWNKTEYLEQSNKNSANKGESITAIIYNNHTNKTSNFEPLNETFVNDNEVEEGEDGDIGNNFMVANQIIISILSK